MNSNLEFEIREIKKRIEFYQQLKADQTPFEAASNVSAKADPIDKWIKIYAEKLILLEKKTQLKSG